MTSWTQIEITTDARPDAAEVLFAFGDGEGVRIEGGDEALAAASTRAGLEAKPGRWLDVLPASGEGARRLVIAVPGHVHEAERWTSLGGHVFEAMVALRLDRARLPPASGFVSEAAFEATLRGALLHSFLYETGRKTPDPAFRPQALVVAAADAALAKRAERSVQAINRARAWVEAPANRLNPETWAEELHELKSLGLEVRVVSTAELEAIGAGAILAVGRGAEHGPRLGILEWRGAPEREGWDAVLVGKGLTFDGGGLNLKPRPVIQKMKFDMGGGAAVLGAVELAASRGARCNVAAVAAMVENAIDALAYRPGDVLSSLSGLTIDVQDTDAEGRLVLADAITYAIDAYHPACLVDVATLTGMITGLLYEEFAGLFANDETLAADLLAAGEETGERLWRLPLAKSQDYVVESSVADVSNLGAPGLLGAGAGSPVAGAKFIEKFVGDVAWAHLDIAGVALAGRRNAFCQKGATGYGVRLLDRWLERFEG